MPYLETSEKINWYYQQQGQGPCLIFLHGWASSSRVFSQQIEYFSKTYRVVAVDLPGHGHTPWIEVHFDQIAQGLWALADHLQEKKVFIIGSSLGGMIGLKCAELFPLWVKKLVMVGSLPKFLKTTEKPMGLSIVEMQRLQKQLQERYPGILDIFFRSLFTLEERESPKFKWIHQFRKTEKVPDRRALEFFLELLCKTDLTEFLKTVKAQVLFLSGDQDYICPKDSFDFLKSLAPGLQYALIQGSGHFPFLIHSQAFNAHVEKFLES